MTTNTETLAPWLQPWPTEQLETVDQCPLCGETQRIILHEDMVDKVFRVAPGSWTLWTCTGCDCAYLDPRPTSDSIHIAYAHYYTHRAATGKTTYEALSPLRKLRRRLLNGYTNWRFGTRAEPASVLGALLMPLLRNLRGRLDGEYRHLPKPPSSGGSMLEIGFGSGAFLELSQQCGWAVKGVDPDDNVVRAAQERGFDVCQGGVEVFDGLEEQFDVIVMNHVIEHVHQPVQVLERCSQLLKTGGILYIETPNLHSLGHSHFGRNWRDLDTPRHLVLFTPDALHRVLQQAGFGHIEWKTRTNPVHSIALASTAINQDRPIEEVTQLPLEEQHFVSHAMRLQALQRDKREYITFMAYKGRHD